MVTKSDLIREIDRRITAAKERGDWQSVELYTCTALRIQRTRDLAVSGLSRRIAAIDARSPLTERGMV
jgi:hypothetical protein